MSLNTTKKKSGELDSTMGSVAGVNAKEISLDLGLMKSEMMTMMGKCQQRGLIQTYKWMAELCFCIR